MSHNRIVRVHASFRNTSSEDLRFDLSDILDPGFGTTGNSSSVSPPHSGTHKERRDFDGGADTLWSLYGKEAKAYNEAEFLSLAADMDGVLVFVSIYSGLRNSRCEEVFFPKMVIFDGLLAGQCFGVVFGSYLSQFSLYGYKIMSNRIVITLCIEGCGF